MSGQSPWPLYLHGPAGVGKTAAALCVLDHYGPAPPAASRSPELLDPLAGYWDARRSVALKLAADAGRLAWSKEGVGGATTWADLMAGLAAAPVVVFDEVGLGASSDFAQSVLLEVIDRRDGDPVRPFVAASNLDPETLARVFDDRTCSRLLCGTVFHLTGPDRRRERPGPEVN